MTPHIETQSASRLISLVRILLYALAVGIIFLMDMTELIFVLGDRGSWLLGLFIGVAVSAVLLAVFASVVRRPWVLILELIFDLCWLGGIAYLCGGVLGPAAPLLYAVVVIGTLLLPGVLPFLLSSVAALILGGNAILYIAGWVPFTDLSHITSHDLGNPEIIISTITVQILALFMIDILGQVLARRTSEQQLVVGDLLDQIGDGILLVDRMGVIRHGNDQARSLLPAMNIEEGVSCRKLFNQTNYVQLAQMLLDEEGMRTEHVTIEKRALFVVANDVRGRRGRLFGRMLALRDETSLRQLEENAQRSEHLASLGEMAAGIAHEFRNPLTSLRGCAQEIYSISKEEDFDSLKKLSRIIVKEADRLGYIVEDVLGFARQHSLYLQPLDLTAFFLEIKEEYKQRLDLPKSVNIVVKTLTDCPRVFTDADKLRQVLHNLIDNALHALEGCESAQITLLAELAQNNLLESSNQAVAVRVQDNGVGIDPEKLSHVFTPFYSTRSQGTGIGLALVQRLVRALGGIIRLDSNVGEGTTATVLLPVHEESEAR